MTLIRHEIPILEHDTDARAVIQPGSNDDIRGALPSKLVYAFLLDEVEKYAAAHEPECARVGALKTITKQYPVYISLYREQRICLCQAPLGSAAAVQLMDDLIARGVSEIIAVGSCGALEAFPENEFLIPVEALRDEGASYHYLPPARTVALSERAICAIERALDARGVKHQRVKTWTTDGFFRETKDMVNHRKAEGCQVVDMECAGLAACAQFRGADFGQLLFTADTLADVDHHDARDWGYSAFGKALALAMDAAVELG